MAISIAFQSTPLSTIANAPNLTSMWRVIAQHMEPDSLDREVQENGISLLRPTMRDTGIAKFLEFLEDGNIQRQRASSLQRTRDAIFQGLTEAWISLWPKVLEYESSQRTEDLGLVVTYIAQRVKEFPDAERCQELGFWACQRLGGPRSLVLSEPDKSKNQGPDRGQKL
ncbi:hypothetical protein J6590_098129 [Homalodisca vitripennis]|nr:hypothetical protein J6590_098129 [Homalodisca vitripennis]